MKKRSLSLLAVGFLTSCVTTKPVQVDARLEGPVSPPAHVFVKVLSVTGTVVDAHQKPVNQAFVCDSFDADLMLGIDNVPRVIGMRTPKARMEGFESFVDGFQTTCSKTNAQGVFTLTAPIQKLKSATSDVVESAGFSAGTEFIVWAGQGLSRVPAKSDRVALGIPSMGVFFRIPESTSETVDMGTMVLKEAKPLALSYKVPPKSLLRALWVVARKSGTGFFRLNFADAEPYWPKGKPLPVKDSGVVEILLPIDETYDVAFLTERAEAGAQQSNQEASHSHEGPISFELQ